MIDSATGPSTEDKAVRVWFVTGASTGLGRAIAEAAAGRGDRVVATARDVAGIERWAGERVHPVRLDVTDRDAVDAAAAAAVERFGRLDVVVNNAGFGAFGALEDLPDETLREQFETNVFGVWNVTRAILPQLRAQRGGHLVQMSSLDGIAPLGPGETAYAASKFAVEGMSEVLAKEAAHLGIRVTIVEPGPVRTGFASAAKAQATASADYDPSVGAALEWFADLDGNQPNDPDRVAAAVLRAVDAADPPLRLVLGSEAVRAVRDKLDAQRRDLDAWAELAESVAVSG
jgi:NAD(P)-dependent dehydrogenase (short-subunit alcohol dehydrogenase family)